MSAARFTFHVSHQFAIKPAVNHKNAQRVQKQHLPVHHLGVLCCYDNRSVLAGEARRILDNADDAG
jgi:hypothetical protein